MNEDIQALAKLRLQELLSFFEIKADVDVTEEDGTILLEASADDVGHLIGRRGDTLNAIQYLLRQIVSAQSEERPYLTVDIGGYKKARAEHLGEKARELADKVRETGEELEMQPMNPAERRMVHTALQDEAGIYTESKGAGRERRVVIKKQDEETPS